MSRIRGAVGVAAVLAIMAVGTACGGSTSETAETSAAPEPWDPCTISDEALIRASLDPASEGPGSLAQGQPGWESCRWTGEDVNAILNASATTGEDHFRNFPGNIDFHELTVAGRPGFTYRQTGLNPDNFCWLTVPLEGGGSLNLQVTRSPFSHGTTPMCNWAVRVGEALVSAAPR